MITLRLPATAGPVDAKKKEETSFRFRWSFYHTIFDVLYSVR